MAKFANFCGYSDVEPYEVVKVVSDRCLEIRPMKAERLHEMSELGFQPGGFVGHYGNQRAQKWDIQPDPEAPVIRIRKSASKAPAKAGKWFGARGRFVLAEEPRKFYDFNF